jgi:hypothetical protein
LVLDETTDVCFWILLEVLTPVCTADEEFLEFYDKADIGLYDKDEIGRCL